ncbi:hypothetical protein JNL27_06220 [bacterium]|nr:hypothetical protein [bacterium]
MESQTKFTETAAAATLLQEFNSLSRRPAKRFTRSTNEAATTFFSKDFLTVADFLAPIGEVLIVPAVRGRDNSVQNFITSNVHRGKKQAVHADRLFGRKEETFAVFLDRLGS